MAIGYIKLYRQLQDHWLWKDKPFSKGQAWIDLLILAGYKEYKAPYKGEVKTYQAGTVNVSLSFLAQRWGWSWHRVKRFILLLESDGMCRADIRTKDTVITIENYSFFQGEGPQTASEYTSKRQTNDEQAANECTTNKNIKNDKNVNKRRSGGKKQSDDVIQAWLDRKMAEQEAEQNGEEEDG